MLVAIICLIFSLVRTRVVVIRGSSSTKPDSGITETTVVFVVSNDTNFYSATITNNVEFFFFLQLACKDP